MLPRPYARFQAGLLLAYVLVLAVLSASAALASTIPPDAARYRADLTRQARLVWGLEAPVSTFAAQIHQESGWDPAARSQAGAEGMAQFMPGTATWISGVYPQALGANEPLNPAWAMRALVTFDRWLWDRLQERPCVRMWNALRGYNGGLGYVQKELRTGQPCEAFRAGWACRENLDYPRRILDRLEPVYERAGWGNGVCP